VFSKKVSGFVTVWQKIFNQGNPSHTSFSANSSILLSG